jgi:hypothetical protein
MSTQKTVVKRGNYYDEAIIINLLLLEWLYSPRGPWPLFSFLIYSQSVGLLERVISSSQGLYLNTGQHKHRINTYTHQTPTITASERAKTVHALHRSATVTGQLLLLLR